ncbi:WD domain, G-beta repeat protein [Dictyocaulus viviparus]|uniref:WD domain, G-beta repeat protein n=1 Tax=Dictyocaulus viviparus TaxID=29172 RepID=A0A0D8XPC1_DICVI|nr:WD domain, G-beta repeat protein [Dictyocaulus viviparus]
MATFVLKGHRSIVNHVRYSPSNRIIASCGVEKIIKVWSSLPIPFSYDKPRIRIKKAFFSELGFDEGAAVDDTAEDLNMLNYFDQLDSLSRLHAEDAPEESFNEGRDTGLENYVVNVDMEGLRAHLMGLETSDESDSDSDGNDYDVALADDDVDGGDAEDEDTFRGSLRALRRRRWRMIRNHERENHSNIVEYGPSPSRYDGIEHGDRETTTDDENEGPRKRLKQSITSSDSSDNEFAVCEGGIPVDVWPVVTHFAMIWRL